jgi:hypothetical protein
MKRAMIMALLASTLLAGLANSRAFASGAPAQPKQGAEPAQAAASARGMDAPYLAVPVIRDGNLANYLFVSIRIEISERVDLWATREKAHFLRDALVRVSHSADLADPNDANALDEARAIAAYRAAAIETLGERAVGPITITASYSSRGGGV